MGKYYVAGIPFDSENSLKHYGVKGMEWNKHKFGIDADDRYIKWLKNAGQNIGRFANNAAQNVAKGATTAARTVGSAVNKGANFVTGNQNRQQYQNQSAAARMMRNPQQAQQRATSYYNQQQAKTLPGIAKTTATSVANTADKLYRESGIKGNVDRISNAITGNTDRATAQSYRDLANFQEDQSAPFHAESPQYSPENLRKKADEYQKAADNAFIPSVQRAAGNVRNAVGQAAGNVGNAVSGAANAVGDWTKGAAQKAADVALWPATREDVVNAAQNVGNAVSGAANKATEGAKGFLNSAGQWVSGAANNVKNTALKAASDASTGASGFINSAGKWVSNATGNVGKAAQDAGKAVSNAAQNVGNTVGQAAEQARGGIGGFFDRVGNAAKDVGNAVGGAANAVGNWAGQAAQDVGGAVQNAGNWIGDRAQDVSGAVSDAAQNVGNFIDQNVTGNSARADAQRFREYARQTDDRNGDWELDANGQRTFPDDGSLNANTQYWANKSAEAQQNADNSLFGRVANAAEYLTGNNARNAVREAQDNWDANVGSRLDDAHRYVNESKEFRENYPWKKDRNFYDEQAAHQRGLADQADQVYGPVLDKAKAAYGQSLPGSVGNAVSGAAGNAVDWARNAADKVGNWAGQAAQNVGNTAGNVADWAQNAAGTVGNAVSGAAGNVADWAGQTAQNVGNYVSEMVNPHYQLNAQQLMDNYHQYLNEHPENPQSPKHADWLRDQVKNDPQLRAYYEQNIQEQTIPEQTIPEQLIQEKLYHSALNDKPDGVSDTFWEKFTADGGTREEYERDWR